MRARVLLLSGDRLTITSVLRDAFGCSECAIVGFEEKAITRFASTLALMREYQTDVLVFATKNLHLQRFQFVLALYLLLGRAKQRAIIDQDGLIIRVTWIRFLLWDCPRFVLELVASLIVLVLTAITLSTRYLSLRRKP